jgi:hypothetical protein
VTDNLDLKQLERKIYTTYHEDGLADIVLGVFIIALGLGFAPGLNVLAQVWLAPLILLMLAAKKRITIPRLGYVKFGIERQKRIQTNLLLAAVAGVVSLLAGIAAYLVLTGSPSQATDILRDLKAIPFGAMLALLIMVVGLSFQLQRFWLYAGLVLGTFVVARWFDDSLHWFVMAVGGVILVAGLVLLVRFLRRYPLPAGR